MLDIDKVFGYDEAMARDGVKMILDSKGEQYFLVRRIPNPDYERRLSQEFRRNKKILDLETEDSEKLSQKLMADVLARTVLLGWEGISLKGKKLAFNHENAVKLLIDYPSLRATLLEFAQDTKNFRPTDNLEEIKKS
jgi:hypothetical protein